ncbi:hypothetical protein [Stenotrophomonas sp.]|uniref:hypothetical protein n=1 Tax=Stenotrophomonas sp. TaxID=69392 RepID=UPI00289B1DE8|nr:hypothetical protein [Stenotrophomonas sp.]
MKRHARSAARRPHVTIRAMNYLFTGLLGLCTAVTAAGACPALAAPPPLHLPLADGTGAYLRIDSAAGSAQLLSAAGSTDLRVNPTLRDALSRSDKVMALGRHAAATEADGSLLLFISAASRPGAPMGYCGAGQEDGLLLLGVREGALVQLDFMLLQSCLDSIDMAIDLADGPVAAFRSLPAPWLVSFAAVEEDRLVQRCVGIRDERLRLEDDCDTAPRTMP